MSTKPEALRLADELEMWTQGEPGAVELRRQHAEIERLTTEAAAADAWSSNAARLIRDLTAERDAALTKLAADPKVQSFLEAHPHNPAAKCKCEHWQSCADCHPTAHAAPELVVQHLPADDTEGGAP